MQNRKTQSRLIFVVIMFLFLLFSQLMGFFIEPITILVSESSPLSERLLNIILPVDMILMLVFLLVWGFAFDRHTRKRLLSLAGFLWGVSAWLMGISPTFATFNLSRAVFGISSASIVGIFAMVGDLFKPTDRGKVLSLLLLAQPFAFVAGTILQNMFELDLGWRAFLILLGAIAFLITLMIHLYIGEPKRGAKEPALANVTIRGTYVFDWEADKRILIKPSLVLLFGLIFFGTIPVLVLLEGMLIYLRDVHTLALADVFVTLLPAMIGAVLAYPIGGFLGDLFFKRNKFGRLLPCLFGFFVPPVSLYLALRLGDVQGQRFLVYILLVSYFVALTLPNLVAMIMDITLPEIRATACALGLFFQTLTFLITPLILSFGQKYLPIGDLILWVCISAWVIGLGLTGWLFIRIPKDIENLRRHMAYRSMLETRLTQLEK